MKKIAFALILLLSACGKRPSAGGGVVVGNGLSGDAGQKFYSAIWKMGLEYSNDFTLEQRDGSIVIDNHTTKKIGEPLSSLIFSQVDTGEREVRNRKELRFFAFEQETQVFENLWMPIAGGTAVFYETQFKYENGAVGKFVCFYFLSADFKVYKAKLQEPLEPHGNQSVGLRNIIQSLHYGEDGVAPNLQFYVEADRDDPAA